MQRRRQQGFTLIEMSIVLVIIGLIVGGVLVGRNLIKQAEVRSLMATLQRYETAATAFRDKYNCMAGDCANATSFFGVASQGCQCTVGVCYIKVLGGTGTCNGDGNGVLGTGDSTHFSSVEYLMFWNHLSLAGMIEGNYSGVYGPNMGAWAYLALGINSPSPFRGGGIAIWTNMSPTTSPWNGARTPSSGVITYASGYLKADGHTYVTVGGIDGAGSPAMPLVSPNEGKQIDTKYDDGFPTTGSILVLDDYGWPPAQRCITHWVASGPVLYDTTDTPDAILCTLTFKFPIGE